MSLQEQVAAIVVAMALSGVVLAQRPGGSNWPSPPSSAERLPGGKKASNQELLKVQRAAEQHKAQAQKDADRLDQLVSELRQELERTPAGTLSVESLKKSQEIEKLAKHLRKELNGE
jgi:hypothetical protein